MKNKLRQSFQQELAFEPVSRRGGARKGAGRKPKGDRALVSHGARPPHAARHPVHVTTKLAQGLPKLRVGPTLGVLYEAFRAGSERLGLRLVHYSVQQDHLHLLVEAEDRSSLSRGLQGLLVRIAKALNRHWCRKGKVFADRFHARALQTPREVRHALAYVLLNGAKHGCSRGRIDPFSSGDWFDGWKGELRRFFEGLPSPVAKARAWLLSIGWRRHGPIDVWEIPGTKFARPR